MALFLWVHDVPTYINTVYHEDKTNLNKSLGNGFAVALYSTCSGGNRTWGNKGTWFLKPISPPARWGLLDFMSVASSSSSSSSFSSLFSSSSSSSPLFSSPLLVSSPRLLSSCSLPDFNHDHPRPVCPAGPQPRPSTPSVPCRTSTASIRAQCSLPDLNHDHPRPVFPAGPQPRGSMPSVPCRTSCRKIWDKECAEES